MKRILYCIVFIKILLTAGVSFAQVVISGSVGADGSYTTLKEAFDAINANLNQAGSNLTVTINSSTTETATAILNQPAGISWNTLTIQPGSNSVKVVSGSLTTPLITLNGADNVIIDGRYSGSGQYLLFRNTRTPASSTGNTVYFQNDCNNDTIRYCFLENNSTANAVISTATTGSLDDMTIDNNEIRGSTGGTIGNCYGGIFINSAALRMRVTNTMFHNFNFVGMDLILGDNGIITGNHFYQPLTSSFAPTQGGMRIGGSGNAHLISGNYIGGSAPFCSGSPWVNTGAVNLAGIVFKSGTAVRSEISFNTIQNINLTSTSGSAALTAILGNDPSYVKIYGNLIGHPTTPNSIQLAGNAGLFSDGIKLYSPNVGGNLIDSNFVCNITTSGSAGFNGIGIASGVNAPSNVIRNVVKKIKMTSTGGDQFNGLVCYFASGYGYNNFGLPGMGNIIGDTLDPQSINIFGSRDVAGINGNFSGTVGAIVADNIVGGISVAGTGGGYFRGIVLFGSSPVIPSTISGNIVKNMSSVTGTEGIESSTDGKCNVSNNRVSNLTSTNGEVLGIVSDDLGVANVSGNIISDLISNGSFDNITGIYATISNGSTITENRIFNITAAFTGGAATTAIGINIAANQTLAKVSRNTIYNIRNLTTANSLNIYTAGIVGSSDEVSNNMISLGSGSSNNMRLVGLSVSSPNIFYNSVLISGTVTTGSFPSFCFLRSGTGTSNLKNNILFNSRTGGTGKHYAIASPTGITNFSSNYNLLNSANPNTVALLSPSDLTFANWKTASGGDLNSLSVVPVSFINAAAGDLHIDATATSCAINGAGTPVSVMVDFDNEARNSVTPDIGADEFNVSIAVEAGADVSICAGSSTTLTATGATSYTWSTGETTSSITVSPTTTTTYTVTGTNAYGCVNTDQVTVTVNPLPGLTINTPTVVQPTCAMPTGTITVSASGGGGSQLEYSVDNGVTWQFNPTFNSLAFSSLAPGSYFVRARIQGGSCSVSYSGNPVVLGLPSCPGKTIPGRIEAESFDAKNGPQYGIPTDDPQGGVQHVIGITNGSWMDYNVLVTQAGLYTVTFRVATTQNNPQFQIKLGTTVLGIVNITNTGGWSNWQNVSVSNIALTAGSKTIRIQSTSNESCNFNWTDWAVAGANTAPSANAGPNQSIVQPASSVNLAGSGIANNGGSITSHVWSKFSGGPATIFDMNAYNTPVTGLTVGTYVFRLTVTQDDNQTATSDVTVVVNPSSGKFIPGRVEAESFDARSGPQYAVPTSDVGGGQHVIGLSNGSWLDYNVNVTQTGAYTVNFRVATTQNNPQFQIKSGATVLATVNIPNTGGWDTWMSVPVTNVALTAGTQTIRIQLITNESCNFNWMDWSLTGPNTAPTVNAGPNQVITLPTNQVTMAGSGSANNSGGFILSHVWTKFSGGAATITDLNNYGTTITGLAAGTYVFRLTVIQNDNQTATSDVTITVNPASGGGGGPAGKVIPGKIEAEAWDAKNGPQYAVPTSDAGGGQQVIGMSNGSWLDYNVTVNQTGTYTVNFRVATTQLHAQFQVKLGAAVLGTINIPSTGGWDTWQTVALNNISLTAGVQTIRIQLSSNESCNFNWTDWVLAAPLTAPVTTLNYSPDIVPVQKEIKGTDMSVSVFPNPAESWFNLKVQSKSMEAATVRITDIAGRQVQQLQAMPGQTIRFGDKMMNGTYLVEVRQGSERVVTKVVKQ